MKKSCIVILGALLFCIGVLSGCQRNADSARDGAKNDSPAGSSPEKTVTIDYWGWIPFNSVQEEMVRAFNEKYPNVQVKAQIMDWGPYWDKLSVELAVGDGPDVFAMNPDNFIKYKEYCEPLDSYAEEEMGEHWQDAFNKSMLDSVYGDDGELRMFPEAFGGQWYLFYNRSLLDEQGLSVPTDYPSLRQVNARLKELVPGISPVIFGAKDPMNIAYYYLSLANNIEAGAVAAAVGGEKTFRDAVFVKAFQQLQQLFRDEILTTDYLGIDASPGADGIFKSKKAFAYLTGSWMAGPYLLGGQIQDTAIAEDQLGVMVMPGVEGEYGVAGSVDHGWCMNVNTQHKTEAMQFIVEWTVGEASQIWINELFAIPCSNRVKLNEEMLKTDEAKRTFSNIETSLREHLVGPRSTGYTSLDIRIGEAVQGVLLEVLSIEEALKQVQTTLEELR